MTPRPTYEWYESKPSHDEDQAIALSMEVESQAEAGLPRRHVSRAGRTAVGAAHLRRENVREFGAVIRRTHFLVTRRGFAFRRSDLGGERKGSQAIASLRSKPFVRTFCLSGDTHTNQRPE